VVINTGFLRSVKTNHNVITSGIITPTIWYLVR
jgi:hypothetical protein